MKFSGGCDAAISECHPKIGSCGIFSIFSVFEGRACYGGRF